MAAGKAAAPVLASCKRVSEVGTKVYISLGFVSNVCQILRCVKSLTFTHLMGSRCQQTPVKQTQITQLGQSPRVWPRNESKICKNMSVFHLFLLVPPLGSTPSANSWRNFALNNVGLLSDFTFLQLKS